jgi:integrase/recombinase XerC
LTDAVRAFVESLPAEKGYSLHTCRAYTRDLEEFARYLKEQGAGGAARMPNGGALGPGHVTAMMVRSYLGYLHQKNQKSSIARKLSTLRSFFKFLVKKGLVEASPVEGVLTP